MSRRIALLTLVLFGSCSEPESRIPPKTGALPGERAHVVVLACETFDPRRMAVYGTGDSKLAAMDRVADEGTVIQFVYGTTDDAAASAWSLATGRHPFHGEDDAPRLLGHLGELAGYHTLDGSGAELVAWFRAERPDDAPPFAAWVDVVGDGDVDELVDSVLTALDECELAADTLVVLAAATGGVAGAPPLSEASLRVPLAFRLPGRLEAGRTSDIVASVVDVVPTVLELLGVEPGTVQGLEGQSFAPLLQKKTQSWRGHAFSGRAAEGGGPPVAATVRDSSWRFSWERGGAQLIFFLREDPYTLEEGSVVPGGTFQRGKMAEWVDAWLATF